MSDGVILSTQIDWLFCHKLYFNIQISQTDVNYELIDKCWPWTDVTAELIDDIFNA